MIQVKVIKKPKATAAAGASQLTTSSNAYSSLTVKEALHAARADEATHAADADNAQQADHADEATHAQQADSAKEADVARNLTADSPVWGKVLKRTVEDTAEERITFNKGISAKGDSSMEGASIDTAAIEEETVGTANIGTANISKALAKLLKAEVAELTKAGIDEVTSDIIFDKLAVVMQKLLADNMESRSTAYEAGLAGYSLHKTEADRYRLEIDELLVRVKAIYNELEIRKLSYVGGNMELSAAGGEIYRVQPLYREGEEEPYAFRCWLTADDGTTRTRNWWKPGDQAKCQTFNIDGAEVLDGEQPLSVDGEVLTQDGQLITYDDGTGGSTGNKYYWRLVTATGKETLEDGRQYDWIDLSNERQVTLTADGVTYTCEGMDSVFDGYDADNMKWHTQMNDWPEQGDSIVQEGSQTDTERRHLIRLNTVGEAAPSIEEYCNVGARDGISPWNLTDRRATAIAPRTGDVFVAKRFEIRTEAGTRVPVPTERGEYTDGMVCGYYDRVSHNGSLWLCVCKIGNKVNDTIYPPSAAYTLSDGSPIWIEQVAKGTNGTPGQNGTDGESSVSVEVNPAYVILTEAADKTIDCSAHRIYYKVYRGTADITADTMLTEVKTDGNCIAQMEEEDDGTRCACITQLTGQPQSGYVELWISVPGVAQVQKRRVTYYVNWLGTFRETIENDVSQRMAEKLTTHIDDVNNRLAETSEHMSLLEQTSEGFRQKVSDQITTIDGELENVQARFSEIELKSDIIALSVYGTDETNHAALGSNIMLANGDSYAIPTAFAQPLNTTLYKEVMLTATVGVVTSMLNDAGGTITVTLLANGSVLASKQTTITQEMLDASTDLFIDLKGIIGTDGVSRIDFTVHNNAGDNIIITEATLHRHLPMTKALKRTGIDITNGLIRISADTTEFTGDVNVHGTLQESNVQDAAAAGFYPIDFVRNRSVAVPPQSIVVMPMICEVAFGPGNVTQDAYFNSDWMMPAYCKAGTNITITAMPVVNIANWSALRTRLRATTGSSGETVVKETMDVANNADFQTMCEHITLVCADPRFFRHYSVKYADTAEGAESGYGMSSSIADDRNFFGNVHGRFLINGAMTRFIALLPGQMLKLKSVLMGVDASVAGTVRFTEGTDVLMWNVENAADFTPIDFTLEELDQPTNGVQPNSFSFGKSTQAVNPVKDGQCNFLETLYAHRYLDATLWDSYTCPFAQISKETRTGNPTLQSSAT